LLVLIAMMGVALTVVSEVWHTAQKREKEQELLFIGNQFRRAIAMYNANGGGYPQRLEDLVKDPRVPGVRRFLRQIYRDPMTGGTEWGLVRSAGNAITGVYSLSDEEPLKKAQFSLADQSFEGKTKYSEWVFISKTAQVVAPPSMTPVPTGPQAQTSGAAPVSPSADGSAGATPPAGSGAAPPAGSGATSIDNGQMGSGGFGPRGRR
jgi:type II secretory pathway pseudopilin PulG